MSLLVKKAMLHVSTGNANADKVLKPIINTQTLIFAAISLIGAIWLGISIVGAIKSYSDHQGGGDFHKHVFGIFAGAVMFFISAVVAFITS